ncbi:potassium-transporting ATPase subunit KdpA [Streptomyces cyaneofuscatus]|uniref:potassium-transporting ATPase subunit KdpA n=1 Tax=Streptomyces cyaneofuscatus TaxID=66883 RepID=UPI003F540803
MNSATSGPTWCAAPSAPCSDLGDRCDRPGRLGGGGAVASQEAGKELGATGGGYFNANPAHPFVHPNPLSSLFEIFLILLIPFALTRTFGRMVGRLGDAARGAGVGLGLAVARGFTHEVGSTA